MNRILFAILFALCSASHAATPTLGPDCGIGATIVGTQHAGTITLGTNSSYSTCTLFASYPNKPTCVGVIQDFATPIVVGAIATRTEVVIYSNDGDLGTLGYLCVGQ